MTALGNQRWRDRKATFRKPNEQINTRAHDVAAIDSDKIAKAFVSAHHYAGTLPPARYRFGLYEHGDLVGVAVFSYPQRDEVTRNVFPTITHLERIELGRFVLLDRVAGNGETWLLARCFELLAREGIIGVVSFSDPMPRTKLDGTIVMPGHVGTIYQAFNGRHLGRASPDKLYLLPDGRSFPRRSYQKIRKAEVGWRPQVKILVDLGADPLNENADADARYAWLDTWMPRLTRVFKHDGNYRYAWAIGRRNRKLLQPSEAYPKTRDAMVPAVHVPCRRRAT